jgi:bifunctional non-homologous end joining protein LigD
VCSLRGHGTVSVSSPALDQYRRKRDPARTPEPIPAAGPLPTGHNDTFVIQEHHASALHWDFRLERDGVLVSWALPKGLPMDPRSNHLAVPTEDHPMEYAAFEGDIAKGEYGGGQVLIWDRGTYETLEWTERKIKVVLRGSRAGGRYVLFKTNDKHWMIHRMDPAPEGYEPMPALIRPMLAVLHDELPSDPSQWAYELKWDGVRAIVYVDGGRPRVMSRNDRDITTSFPELRQLAAAQGSRQVVLDGEIVAMDGHGRPSFQQLQARTNVTDPARVRRLAASVPVTFVVFDVLHLDGRSTLNLPYGERRRLLESLELNGDSWRTPPVWFEDGESVLDAVRKQGMEGVMAKRLDSPYLPGRRSDNWRKVKSLRTQEVVIGGWREGTGRRAGQVGSLLVGVPDERGLQYVGKVGTGFTERALADLSARLTAESDVPPFANTVPRADAQGAHWVEPVLVGEVRFSEWTRDGRLRHPAWRGLRFDKTPADVRREC